MVDTEQPSVKEEALMLVRVYGEEETALDEYKERAEDIATTLVRAEGKRWHWRLIAVGLFQFDRQPEAERTAFDTVLGAKGVTPDDYVLWKHANTDKVFEFTAAIPRPDNPQYETLWAEARDKLLQACLADLKSGELDRLRKGMPKENSAEVLPELRRISKQTVKSPYYLAPCQDGQWTTKVQTATPGGNVIEVQFTERTDVALPAFSMKIARFAEGYRGEITQLDINVCFAAYEVAQNNPCISLSGDFKQPSFTIQEVAELMFGTTTKDCKPGTLYHDIILHSLERLSSASYGFNANDLLRATNEAGIAVPNNLSIGGKRRLLNISERIITKSNKPVQAFVMHDSFLIEISMLTGFPNTFKFTRDLFPKGVRNEARIILVFEMFARAVNRGKFEDQFNNVYLYERDRKNALFKAMAAATEHLEEKSRWIDISIIDRPLTNQEKAKDERQRRAVAEQLEIFDRKLDELGRREFQITLEGKPLSDIEAGKTHLGLNAYRAKFIMPHVRGDTTAIAPTKRRYTKRKNTSTKMAK